MYRDHTFARHIDDFGIYSIYRYTVRKEDILNIEFRIPSWRRFEEGYIEKREVRFALATRTCDYLIYHIISHPAMIIYEFGVPIWMRYVHFSRFASCCRACDITTIHAYLEAIGVCCPVFGTILSTYTSYTLYIYIILRHTETSFTLYSIIGCTTSALCDI